jgi:hypothetical protein
MQYSTLCSLMQQQCCRACNSVVSAQHTGAVRDCVYNDRGTDRAIEMQTTALLITVITALLEGIVYVAQLYTDFSSDSAKTYRCKLVQ